MRRELLFSKLENQRDKQVRIEGNKKKEESDGSGSFVSPFVLHLLIDVPSRCSESSFDSEESVMAFEF